MKIAVLGAGAVGSYIGGLLAKGLNDVTLITTNAEHRKAVTQNGLTIQLKTDVHNVRISCTDPTEYVDSPDIIIVLCKAHQTTMALDGIVQSIHENTLLLSLQNGIGHERVLANYVNNIRIMLGNTMVPVERVSAGVVRVKGEGQTAFNLFDTVSNLPHNLQMRDMLCSQLNASGVDATVDADIQSRLWRKASFNAGMNAVGALARCTNGDLASSASIYAMVVAAAMEGLAVAKAQGIAVDAESLKNLIAYACSNHAQHSASMLQDVQAQRPTEITAINGEIVRQGKITGVATPSNSLLFDMVQLVEASYSH